MKLAFLIATHKDARHLRDLVNSLPADADYFVHVDSQRDLSHFREGIDRPNVHFISHRVNCVEGSITEVEAQVELLREALSTGTYDYLVYLGGQDYPLWSNSRITDFFAKAGGKEIIKAIALPGQGRAAYPYCDFHPYASRPWRKYTIKGQARVSLRRLINGLHIHKTLYIHCPAKTYTLYKGATSWAITPDVASLIVEEWDDNRWLVNYFHTSYRPAETFVPTVVFNSVFAPRAMEAKGRYPGMDALSPLTYIDGSPKVKVLTEVDFTTLKACDKMFCRQMTTRYSDGLKSMIDNDRAADSHAAEKTEA